MAQLWTILGVPGTESGADDGESRDDDLEGPSRHLPHEDQYWEEPAQETASEPADAQNQSDYRLPSLAAELLCKPETDQVPLQRVHGLLDVVLGKRLPQRSGEPHRFAEGLEHAARHGVQADQAGEISLGMLAAEAIRARCHAACSRRESIGEMECTMAA